MESFWDGTGGWICVDNMHVRYCRVAGEGETVTVQESVRQIKQSWFALQKHELCPWNPDRWILALTLHRAEPQPGSPDSGRSHQWYWRGVWINQLQKGPEPPRGWFLQTALGGRGGWHVCIWSDQQDSYKTPNLVKGFIVSMSLWWPGVPLEGLLAGS